MAARGDDLLDFYRRDPDKAIVLALTNVSAQIPAPLPPGRYLLILRAVAGVWAWFRAEPFVATGTVTVVAAQGIPLSPDAMQTIEINVRKGHNDRIAAITEAGVGTLYIVPLARPARR